MKFRRILGVIVFLLLAGYIGYSIVKLSDSPADGNECTALNVKVVGHQKYQLLDSAMVSGILSGKGVSPIGRKMSEIRLDTIENVLEAHPLVISAECYKTSGNDVKIRVKGIVPILRVMSRSGGDYLLDERGEVIDSRVCAVNLPVATGYISPSFAKEKLIGIARVIDASEFWKNQIEQIYVDAEGQVLLVPRVGSHTITLGTPDNVEEKLDKVYRFYAEALKEIGWNKYSDISVAFDGQVVCRKR